MRAKVSILFSAAVHTVSHGCNVKVLADMAAVQHSETMAIDMLRMLCRSAYLAALMQVHPDKGGSTESFQALQEAYKQLTSLVATSHAQSHAP